jgi:hypothetical protein
MMENNILKDVKAMFPTHKQTIKNVNKACQECNKGFKTTY